MVEPGVIHDVEHGAGGPGAMVRHGIDQPTDSRLHHGASAHRARLHRRVDGNVREPPASQPAGGFTKHQQLGVGGRVGPGLFAIVLPRNNRSGQYRHCTDRHVAVGLGHTGLFQRKTHQCEIGGLVSVLDHTRGPIAYRLQRKVCSETPLWAQNCHLRASLHDSSIISYLSAYRRLTTVPLRRRSEGRFVRRG